MIAKATRMTTTIETTTTKNIINIINDSNHNNNYIYRFPYSYIYPSNKADAVEPKRKGDIELSVQKQFPLEYQKKLLFSFRKNIFN